MTSLSKYDEYSELMTTAEVCKLLFGKYTDSTRQNLYNYIKEKRFPEPRIKKRGNYRFSNQEIFMFVRHGVMDDDYSVGD